MFGWFGKGRKRAPVPARSGRKPLEDYEFGIRVLDTEDLPAVVALQDKVRDFLPDEFKSFIVTKTEEEFADYMTGRGVMVGAFLKGHLIGQSIVALPKSPEDELELRLLRSDLPADRVAIFKGDLVDPDHRRIRVHQAMAFTRLTMARQHDRVHALGEIASYNTPSLRNGLAGLLLIAIREDPDDGTPLYYLHRPLESGVHYEMESESISVPRTDLTFQRDLLARGFLGTQMIEDDRLLFRKCSNVEKVLRFLNGH